MAVDGENQFVVETGVTNNASDQGQLLPMIDGAAAACGEAPDQVLADAGYGNEQDLRELEERGVDGYVALALNPLASQFPRRAFCQRQKEPSRSPCHLRRLQLQPASRQGHPVVGDDR